MQGFMALWQRSLLIALCVGVSSCVPVNQDGSLSCTTDSGASVNVHEIYGTWTMTSGYTDGPRSAAELENDYDVLVVQTGKAICRVTYVSKAAMETAFVGTYTNNVNAKSMAISLLAPTTAQVTASYSFSGGCSAPTMTLRYNNGAVERYNFRSKDTGDGCGLTQ